MKLSGSKSLQTTALLLLLLSLPSSPADERGRNSPVTELKVPIRVPKDQLRAALAKQAGFVVNVQLRSGRNRLAVTVLDDVGKISSTATASYPPGGEAETGREGR